MVNLSSLKEQKVDPGASLNNYRSENHHIILNNYRSKYQYIILSNRDIICL